MQSGVLKLIDFGCAKRLYMVCSTVVLLAFYQVMLCLSQYVRMFEGRLYVEVSVLLLRNLVLAHNPNNMFEKMVAYSCPSFVISSFVACANNC